LLSQGSRPIVHLYVGGRRLPVSMRCPA
jgi:hypothetical protein